jgi:hypothetical protein
VTDTHYEPGIPKHFCTKCYNELPRTAEYFYRDSRKPNGLHTFCKKCSSKATNFPATDRSDFTQLVNRNFRMLLQDKLYAKKMSHREAAKICGLAPNLIHHYLAGTRAPTLSSAIRIAIQFNMDLNSLKQC